MSAGDGRLKILVVSPLPPPAGGVATWTEMVLREMKCRSDVVVNHIDSAVRWRSITNYNIGKRVIGGGLQGLKDIMKVFLCLTQSKPHVLHLCTSGSLALLKDLLVLRMAKIFHVATVLHVRMGRIPTLISKNSLEWRLMRHAILLANVVITLDEESQRSVKEHVPGGSVYKIPNPADTAIENEKMNRSYDEENKGKRIIVFIGHVLPAKGVRELIEACCAIGDRSLELHIIGPVESSYRRELETIAEKYGNAEWMIFHGQKKHEETLKLLARASVFVLPSYSEGFPNTLLEAMVSRRPIVATRVGAIPEMLTHMDGGLCGLLVEPGNVAELRESIKSFLKDREYAASMGARAREKVLRNYSVKKVLRAYIDVWKSCVR